MTCIGDFKAMFMGSENEGAFLRNQQRSEERSTDRAFVSAEPSSELGLLEALGIADERGERLRRLKAAIASGHYHVSSSDLAERLMHSMLED
jgi:anti-sigma28 factor (negative regulator of flagellin synthesis)